MANILYVRGMNIQRPENLDGYFFGEHSKGYGNIWDAVFGASEKFLVFLRKVLHDGKVMFQGLKTPNKQYAGIKYPENNKFSVLSLIEENEKSKDYVSSYPLLIGINNEVKLKEAYSWAIEGEGEMAAETNLGKIINFHNPYFAVDNKNFKFDRVQTISLAGLAMTIDKMEVQEFPAEGDTYKHFLEEFLKENPGKTEKDFETPIHRVDAEHFRMFVPTDYCSEFEIATQIEEIEYVEFLGEKIAVMKVNLEHGDDNEYLYCNIYASQHVLGKYKPKVGDGINAVVWMTGFFN